MPVQRPARAAIVTTACAVALSVFPARAAAQRAAFVEAFVDFHSRLIGTYGDEGPQIARAVDEMALRLAEWERRATVAEASETAPANLAVLHLDGGQRDAALEAIDAAITAEPTRAPYHRLRGLILEFLGRQDDAIAALETAWTLDPADPISAYLLADRRAARTAGDDLNPQAGALLAAYERTGAPPGRVPRPFIELALVEDRAADVPIFSPALYAEGLTFIAQGRYQDALSQFRQALKRDPLVADFNARSQPMAGGIAAVRQGRLEEAIPQLQSAVEASPTSSEAHRILGAAYRATGDAAKSVEHLSTAVRLAPGDERARVTLGRALADAGRHEEAERTLREAIETLPESGEALWALADLYEKLGRGPESIAELRKAASFTVLAGKGPVYWRLADLAHRHQDYELVVEALRDRARLMPNEAGAHKDLGLAYARVGRQEQALVELVMTALLGLDDAETLAAIGQIHLDAGRFAEAVAILERAVARQPDLPQALYALGTALVRLGRAADGRVHLAEFQRLRMQALENQRRQFEQPRETQPAAEPVR